ncbi:hypothetical protein [Mycobacterium sp. Root265]|uniref:hypothetical protein n=1 Tax=Mycobacterium sp. Root265 TaxID=1736504 RepID=UPI000AA5D047|nr:hypothetical protein [Mycobacterium sp. Root265]
MNGHYEITTPDGVVIVIVGIHEVFDHVSEVWPEAVIHGTSINDGKQEFAKIRYYSN